MKVCMILANTTLYHILAISVTHVQAKVAPDCSWVTLEWVGRAQHFAPHADHVFPFPGHADHRAGYHVRHHLREEGFVHQVSARRTFDFRDEKNGGKGRVAN